MVKKAFVGILLILASTAVYAAVDVRVDRHQLVFGETVTLILETSDSGQELDIDPEALSQDFEILDQRTESQVSIVNGEQTASIRLLVSLEPKRTGEIEIPSLRLGQVTTDPVRLQVLPAPPAADGQPEPVFIEISAQPDADGKIYVHSQISLSIKLFYDRPLTEGRMSEPQAEHASVQLINETPYSAERNGARYRVLERRYAVYPERSGTLTFEPVRFSGRISDRQRGSSFWSNSRSGRRVDVTGDALTFEVIPKPDSYPDSDWLPARKLDAQQTINIPQGGLHVGEPVTRTVKLEAEGVNDSMLPDITWPETDGVRIYPEPPARVTRAKGAWHSGRVEHRFAVVPSIPGELSLPELRIPWWNTVTDTLEYAVIPAETVTVLPAAGTAVTGVPPVPAQPEIARAEPAANAGAGRFNLWAVTTGLFALLWLTTLALLLRRRQPALPPGPPRPEAAGTATLLKQLRAACETGRPADAARALRAWAISTGQSRTGQLDELARDSTDSEFRPAVLELSRHCYAGQTPSSWDGESFWGAFERWRRQRNTKRRDNENRRDSLPALYPGS